MATTERNLGDYKFIRHVGAGNFGTISLVQHVFTQEFFAMKTLKRSRTNEHTLNEVLSHRVLNHPNVIGFKQVLLSDDHLHIVMEYAQGGELFSIMQHVGKFSENDARYFMQQIVCALDAMHTMGIAHRDLKLENVLVKITECGAIVKLCDFGYSTVAGPPTGQGKGIVGTPLYIAPEVLRQRQADPRPGDVWAAGVILYTMLVGNYPFIDPYDRKNCKEIMRKTLLYEPCFPQHLSPSVVNLLLRMLSKDPAQRITVAEIKQHEWYLERLPVELTQGYPECAWFPVSTQPVTEIIRTVKAAQSKAASSCVSLSETSSSSASFFDDSSSVPAL